MIEPRVFARCKSHVIQEAVKLGMDRYEANTNVYPIQDFYELLSFVYFLRDAYNAPEDVLNVSDVIRLDLYLAPWESYSEWELV